MPMEYFAHVFDQPIESQEHQSLAADAWLGGAPISLRYWLGRLLRRNFFRDSDDAVKQALRQYLVEIDCEKGAFLFSDPQCWSPVTILLRHQVEVRDSLGSTQNAKKVAAVKAMLANPDLTDLELAAIAKTTGKQIARMSDLTFLRKLWKYRDF